MGSFEILQLIITGLYLLAAILFFTGVFANRERLRALSSWMAVVAFGLHTVDIGAVLFMHRGAALASGNFYFSLFAWSLILIYFVVWWRLRSHFLGLTASPLALILFFSSTAVQHLTVTMPKKLTVLFVGMHIGTLFLSMALLAMAFGAGMAFMYLDRKIKAKEKLEGFRKEMPSLETFDKVNHWAIVAGFPLYTFGLVSGFIWGRQTWGKVFTWDPKEIIAVFIWFAFAFLFHQRLIYGWKGRKPARLAIWVFLFTLVSMVGVNFLLPTHHSFKP